MDWGRPLDSEAARADLALFRRAIEELHPGLGRYVPAEEFAGACDALAERLEPGTTDLDLYRELSLVAAGLRCGHTRVEGPAWLDERRRGEPTHLPFRFRLFDRRMHVVVAPAASALAPGTEVLAIEGRPVAELIGAIAATVPIDGWTDSIRASRLEAAYEYEDSGFDHYLPLWLGFRDRYRVTLRASEDAAEFERDLGALTLDGWKALADDGPRDFADAVSWKILEDGTALLRVDTFVNYRRTVDAEATFLRAFEALHEADCERLVLDLRACGGGSSDVGWTLARFLIDEPIEFTGERWVRARGVGDLRPHLTTWDESLFDPPAELLEPRGDGTFRLRLGPTPALEPHPARFEGPITVLIGPYNASGSTMLLARLVESGAVRTLGEPTGGSAEGPTAGTIFFLTLPSSGIRVNVPVVRESSGARTFRPGLGIAPDVLVSTTLADVLAGRDPVLEAALDG